MEVGGWLRTLGLEQYESAFRENNIDQQILPKLTMEDLRELGVGSVGHRRKLLDAIAALASSPALPYDAPPETNEGRDAAERRQVTVVFADLVGSTSLSARMDPEDLREIIITYQKCVADAVRRLEGFVAKYMGDGVLIYFGYPEAHEDDAERAVRAALDVIAGVGALKLSVPLQSRIGIATGLVVVGDLIGSGESHERGIVGETPNLAARLQGLAEPNTVVIAEATRRLLGNLFDLRDLGSEELKGIARPVRAFAVLRASSVEGRFEAMHPDRLIALVGREEELQLLLRQWARAKSGTGKVVLLSGEAGIGKSRLSAALMEAIAAESHTRLRYFCSPQHTDSTLYPIIGHFERAAGFEVDDTPRAKLDKISALLRRTNTSSQDAALFAEMLSLSNDDRFPALELTPERRRQKTLEALGVQLGMLARSTPVLMIVEDAHWVDPTSLEAFSRLVDQIEILPVLLIVTFRPEFAPPWVGRSYVTAVALNRLAPRDVGVLINHVLGDKLLAANIQEDIIERTDGIPLFVEEMTKAVLEAQNEGDAHRTAAAVPSPATAVPASLHASLMARLDRLGSAKELAQIGSAIGREFSVSLLAAVARKSKPELSAALETLVAVGLLLRQGMSPHVNYLFKHALVQDAAYSTLLREPRRALHARIVYAFESQFAETVENQPELLARHCTEAGLIEKAVRLWTKAGQRSLERSALVEAVVQLYRALEQIGTLPATPERRREQIRLQVALITPLVHVKGYAAPETKEAAERARLLIEQARALGEPPEDPLLLFSILYGVWVANYVAFKGDVVRDLAIQFLALAQKQTDSAPVMIGHRLMGQSLLYTGDVLRGRAHYDQAIELYDPKQHRQLAARFGQDVGAAILCYRSFALWLLGYPEAAGRDIAQALSDAREIGHAATLMYTIGHAQLTFTYCGDYGTADALADEIISLANEKGAPIWKAFGTLNQGLLYALTGRPAKAVQMISAGLTAWRSTGSTLWTPLHLPHMALAYAELGRFEDAQRCISEAMLAIENTKETWCESEVYRIAGDILLMSNRAVDIAKAQHCFEQALLIARAQKSRSLELRASMSVARLLRGQTKQSEARTVLAPMYGWFTEGFNTLDLRQAKALLESLA